MPHPSSPPPPRLRGSAVALALALATVLVMVGAAPAGAHTESDVVAVPAGQPARVTLAPTHGCGPSGTVEVAALVPVPGAVPEAVPGWTHTATDDGSGSTVVEWTGGLLPTDQAGAFPVSFTAPETPGEVLTFPFVQVCEDDEELAWIDGDPAGERPAPRLLVLPPGAEPATSIDDVPADAPGRDDFALPVDVDNPRAAPPTTTAAAAPATTSAPTNGAPTTGQDDEAAVAAVEDQGGGGGSVLPIVAGLALLAVVVAAAPIVVARRRGR